MKDLAQFNCDATKNWIVFAIETVSAGDCEDSIAPISDESFSLSIEDRI